MVDFPFNMSRRDFLLLMGSAVVAARGLAGCDNNSSGNDLYDDGNRDIPTGIDGNAERVIVIGAGIAGLTVANALAHAGVEVTVLEGRDRIGGRAHTIELAGASVDLGCAWMHTPIGNPIARFATQVGVGRIPAFLPDMLDIVSLFDAFSGSYITQLELQSAVEQLGRFDKTLPSLRMALGPSASTEAGILRFLDEQPGLTESARRQAEFVLRFRAENECSGSWRDISLEFLAANTVFQGSDVFPDGGYTRLVNAMGEGLDVRLGETVTKVNILQDSVSVVTQVQGPGSPQETRVHQGSHVVVTLPLGVLKSNAVQFSPQLPEKKQDAIQALGVGTFDKVVLRFDEAFWVDQQRSHILYLSKTPQEYPLWLDYNEFYGAPVLALLFSGDFGRSVQQMGEAEIRARLIQILHELYGQSAPEPQEVIVTDWGTNPFTRGDYSFVQVGASVTDFDRLAEPEFGRLLFAGEATSSTRYGFADGALSTGVREAKRLLGVPAVRLAPLGNLVRRESRLHNPLALLDRIRRHS